MSENTLEKHASVLKEAREWGARQALEKLASAGLLKEEVLAKIAEEDATETLEMVKEAGVLEGSIETANNIIDLLRANPEKTAMQMADDIESAGNNEMAGMGYGADAATEELPPEVVEAAEAEAVAGAAEVVAVAKGLPSDTPEVVELAEEIVTEAAPAEEAPAAPEAGGGILAPGGAAPAAV